jgi:glucosamine kinase
VLETGKGLGKAEGGALDCGGMELVLGIDGGGSHTRACVADLDGRVLGSGRAGSSNYNHAGAAGAGRAIEAAVREALSSVSAQPPAKAMFLGLAAVVNEADRAVIQQEVGQRGLAMKIGIDHDIRIALSGGLAGQAGIALIAGTGASCYGRRATGESVQVGGYGFLADDVGSASWISRQALSAAVREADGRLMETDLKKAVFAFLEITDIRDFLHRVQTVGLKREELATLCPRIIALADSGNGPAQSIMEEAVRELALLVQTAASRLSFDSPAVVLAGGLALSGAPFQPALEAAIRQVLPGVEFPEPALPAVGGALLEALRLAGVNPQGTILGNLKETIRHVGKIH